MNTTLWIIQSLLAITFLLVGIAKSTFSRQKFIETKQTGVVDLPMRIVRFIGISEILASIGLVVPWFTNIAPMLTPLVATGLAIIMVLAAFRHQKLHEPKNVRNNLILLGLCVFVAAGRLMAWFYTR